MGRSQWRSVLIVALRLVITLLFVPAILVSSETPARALWIPALAAPATAALMITTAGATGTWLIHGPRSTAAYPGTILVLLASLAWLQRATVKRNVPIEHLEPLSK